MYTNSVTKLSILALIALCLLAAGSRAALVHYWTLDTDDPNLYDDGLGYSVFGPHAAQLVDPHASYTPPTPCVGKFRGGYDLGNNPLTFSDICIGGFGPSEYMEVDGTLPTLPVTVSLWFYPYYLPDQRGNWFLLANYRDGDNTIDRFYIHLYTPDVAGAPSGVGWSIGETKDYGLGGTPVAPYIVSANAWHHIMMSVQYAGNGTATVTYSLDGGPARTGTATLTNNPASFDKGNKRLGTNGNQLETGKTFHGKLDDAAIWNEILPMPASGFNAASFIWNSGAGRAANVATGKVAYDPTPGDKSVGNAGTTQLKWYNAPRLPSTMCNVFFSTVREDLIDPVTNQPIRPGAKRIAYHVPGTPGSLSTCNVTLSDANDYYWRVDTLNSNYPTDPNIYSGPLWKFSANNAVPQINAGETQYKYLSSGSAVISLSGTATDDGLPIGETVTATWKDPDGNPLTTNVTQNGNVYTCTAQHTQTETGYFTYTLVANDTTGDGTGEVMIVVKGTPCEAAKANPDYVNIKNASDIDDDCLVTFKDFALSVNKWRVCTALDNDCD